MPNKVITLQNTRIYFYPWKLKEAEVLEILQAWPNLEFGKEPDKAKDYLDLFHLSGTLEKVKIRDYYIKNRELGNKLAKSKAQMFLMKLASHPFLITESMHAAIDNSYLLKIAFGKKTVKVMPAGDNQSLTVVENTNPQSPLVHMETIKADILENLIDKTQAVLHAITGGKIQRASLGTLSKTLENLMKSYIMFKGETTPKTFLQVNINQMNLAQKKELSLKLGESSAPVSTSGILKK